ncbi:hypothetical protein ALI22I_03850 [Saccharothrix sp. ALI-22-I]|uniref:hypothetical protein n=1 Tax=Saccharothrix sp. ALI-22-I TaxID=1933778 RepID=UPI00097BF1D5|nr:hypothetical protein [Saccharothrix sp. ALI-22-I]ONI92404.1 hypothetical protein ALI22I_03850 [Saccharothrix sp. ALI-22-I]
MDPKELMSSSQRWMRQGLAAFTRNDGSQDFAVHHVGVAMEHLLKAYLASLHPVHIVEEKHWDSLLHATGHADRTKTPRSRTKTIGLSVAFDRVKRLIPKISVTSQEFELVRTARDGVAHVGYHDQGEVRAVLTTAIRLAIPVLAEIEQLHDVDNWALIYWSDYSQLRDDLVNEHTTELRLAVTAKITRARSAFRERVVWTAAEQRKAMIEAIGAHNPYPFAVEHEQRADSCPACEGRGWLHGPVTIDWRNDDGEGGGPFVTFYPDGYECAVCSLSLGSEELEILQLDSPIELVDVDPTEWLEPDEDIYRDR